MPGKFLPITSSVAILLCVWSLLAGCQARTTEPTTTEPASEGMPETVALGVVEPTETIAPTATTEPRETAVPPTSTSEPTLIPEPFTNPVIILKRSGGFAGLEDTYMIYADGRAEGSETNNNPVSTEHLAQILTEAEAGGFFDLKDQYIDTGHCCDFFNYEVTLNLADGRSHTITTIEQTPSMPSIVEQIIQEINVLLFSSDG